MIPLVPSTLVLTRRVTTSSSIKANTVRTCRTAASSLPTNLPTLFSSRLRSCPGGVCSVQATHQSITPAYAAGLDDQTLQAEVSAVRRRPRLIPRRRLLNKMPCGKILGCSENELRKRNQSAVAPTTKEEGSRFAARCLPATCAHYRQAQARFQPRQSGNLACHCRWHAADREVRARHSSCSNPADGRAQSCWSVGMLNAAWLNAIRYAAIFTAHSLRVLTALAQVATSSSLLVNSISTRDLRDARCGVPMPPA